MKIVDVYLEDFFFSVTCNATIPAAWVAVVVDDHGNESKHAFAAPYEHDTRESALLAARKQF